MTSEGHASSEDAFTSFADLAFATLRDHVEDHVDASELLHDADPTLLVLLDDADPGTVSTNTGATAADLDAGHDVPREAAQEPRAALAAEGEGRDTPEPERGSEALQPSTSKIGFCARCGGALPPRRRRDRAFCSGRCRTAACRQRKAA